MEGKGEIVLIGGREEYAATIVKGAPSKIVDIVVSGSERPLKREFTLAQGSALRLVSIVAGPCEVDYAFDLQGEYAEIELYSLHKSDGNGKTAVSVTVNHNAPLCRSYVLAKGLASGSSEGVFRALAYVAPGAQQSVAGQLSRNILLSPDAMIIAAPRLEIHADDVRCSHGATVGQLDQEQIYYMRQRGIPEEEARRLQLAGFVNEIVSKIGDAELEADIHALTGLQQEE